MKKPNPRHPNMRGDFGDIGDIFRKPSNHAVLPVFGFGDILGMSPRDGDFTRKIPLRVRAAPVDSMRQKPALGGAFDGKSARRPRRTTGSHICAQDTIACAPHRSIRCGEPLPRKVGAPSVLGMAGTPPGSTCERQPFPFWQQFGISEPSPRRSLAPVNSFSRRILETSRLDFLNHPFACEWHSRANARRRIADHPIAILARVAAQEGLASATGANLNLQR